MFFIGDAHGEFKTYLFVLTKMKFPGGKVGADCSIQLGDMGIGFPGKDEKYSKDGKSYPPTLDGNHRFIYGNHDDPKLSKSHPNCLTDFGYHRKSGIFYVSGGLSVDKEWRIPGVSWWEDEELSYEKGMKTLELYSKVKPPIVVSHECPTEVKLYVMTNNLKLGISSRTENLLQNMLEIHRPDIWIFGHHHRKKEQKIRNTLFVGLDELIYGNITNCVYEIPEIKWE